LTSKSLYGIRILFDLAVNQKENAVQAAEISKRQNISVKYLEQLIRPLKNAELITSIRGPKGGHRLRKLPDDITLGQIIRIFEPYNQFERNPGQLDAFDMECDLLVAEAWQKGLYAFYEVLDSVTITDLIKDTCMKF